MSPEVPMVIWNLFRWLLAIVGAILLRRMKQATLRGYKRLTFGYHMFVTAPAALQALLQLVRATVNLTSRRSELGERTFQHLLTKEVGRTAMVSYLCSGGLVMVPPALRHGELSLGKAT